MLPVHEHSEAVRVFCPWCANAHARIAPTRRLGSWRLVCLGGCGRAGFVSGVAAHCLKVWRAVVEDGGFAQWLGAALDGFTDLAAGPVEAEGFCPVCLGGGALLKPDRRSEPFLEDRACRCRLFGGRRGWPLAQAWQRLLRDQGARNQMQQAFREADLQLALEEQRTAEEEAP